MDKHKPRMSENSTQHVDLPVIGLKPVYGFILTFSKAKPGVDKLSLGMVSLIYWIISSTKIAQAVLTSYFAIKELCRNACLVKFDQLTNWYVL